MDENKHLPAVCPLFQLLFDYHRLLCLGRVHNEQFQPFLYRLLCVCIGITSVRRYPATWEIHQVNVSEELRFSSSGNEQCGSSLIHSISWVSKMSQTLNESALGVSQSCKTRACRISSIKFSGRLFKHLTQRRAITWKFMNTLTFRRFAQFEMTRITSFV